MAEHHPDLTIDDLLTEQRFLLRLARELVGDDLAPDLVQETYVTLLENPPERRGNMHSWARRVMRNKSVDYFRRLNRRRSREERIARPERLPSSEEVIERLEVSRQIAETIQELPEAYRQALFLHGVEERPPRLIAKGLGVPVATVYTRLARGKQLLRERLDQRHDGQRQAWAAPIVLFMERKAERSAPAVKASAIAGTTVAAVGLVLVGVATLAFRSQRIVGDEVRAARSERVQTADESSAAASTALEVRGTTLDDQGRIPIEQEPGRLGAVELRVTFVDDGAPASFVRGHLEQLADDRAGDRKFTLSASGSATVTDLTPGTWVARFPGRKARQVLVDAGASSVLDVALPDGVDVEGVVLDELGRPVPDAEIFHARDINATDEWTITTTDNLGRFRARDLEPWQRGLVDCQIAARVRGQLPSETVRVVAEVGTSTTVELRLLGRATPLAIKVVGPEGEPSKNTRVHVRPRTPGDQAPNLAMLASAIEGFTDDEGRWSSTEAWPGPVEITLFPESGAGWKGRFDLDARGRNELELSLPRGANLTGRVTDQDGRPCKRILVEARDPVSNAVMSSRTDVDGRFDLGTLSPGAVQVRVSGYQHRCKTERVELVRGRAIDLSLQVEHVDDVVGRLLWDDGSPVRGYRLRLVDPTWPKSIVTQARMNADGSFRIVQAPEGAAQLVLTKAPAGSTPPLAVFDWSECVARDWTITVPRVSATGASVNYRVRDTNGNPIPGLTVVVSRASDAWRRFEFPTAQGDDFASVGLTKGDYRLSLFAPGFVRREIEVQDMEAGEVRDLDVIELSRGGAVAFDVDRTNCPDDAQAFLRPVDGGADVPVDLGLGGTRTVVVPAGTWALHLSQESESVVTFDVLVGERVVVDVPPDSQS